MLLYAALGLCAVAIGIGVYRYDLYDREPWTIVIFTVVAGAVAMYLAGVAEVAVVSALGSTAASHWDVTLAAAAGVFEETAKLMVVLAVIFAFRRHFNDPLDGIIYGSFAGLGAAIEESLYVLGLGPTPAFLPPQEPIRLLGHLVMGGIGASGLGSLAPRRPGVPRLLCIGLPFAGAILIHFSWDAIAFSAARLGRMPALHTGAAVALMLGGLVAYLALVGALSRRSRRALQPDSPKRLLGWPFSRLWRDI
jgi:RsiW-degrading membrane proteinase PrsW (M82 family)